MPTPASRRANRSQRWRSVEGESQAVSALWRASRSQNRRDVEDLRQCRVQNNYAVLGSRVPTISVFMSPYSVLSNTLDLSIFQLQHGDEADSDPGNDELPE